MFNSRKYKIEITYSCHEDWNKMTPAGNGRFCDSCSKKVVDFTGLNEKEILLYIKSNRNGGCGRFTTPQIEKSYVAAPAIQVSAQKRFFGFLFSVFMASEMIPEKLNAQPDTTCSSLTDTVTEIAGIDTVCADEPGIAKNDSVSNKQDSAEVDIVSAPEVVFINHAIICGSFVPSRVDTLPMFDQLFKKKKNLKKEDEFVQNNLPVPIPKPLRKESGISDAVLPEEMRRKTEQKE
jgi:hypothetical protein